MKSMKLFSVIIHYVNVSSSLDDQHTLNIDTQLTLPIDVKSVLNFADHFSMTKILFGHYSSFREENEKKSYDIH